MKDEKTDREFENCKWIWSLYLCELNWNNKAVNPLEIVPESFWPEITDRLIEGKYIGQDREYYLNQSRKYTAYLGKGGMPYLKAREEQG
tara:strand:- start:737 stop:1003 length:267 start_codon:yes stop_codon:yes gene_type:complete